MRLFAPLYERTLAWARHRRAPTYLAGLSFAEATFFPVPPDVMLIPMVLGRRERGLRYALICTLASVSGGVLGYLIGAFAFQWLEPWLHRVGYWESFEAAQDSFRRWGFWFILLAGFSPIPYKVFTIAAGVVGMPWLPFLAGSAIGRGGRFFLVSGLIMAGGEPMASAVRRHVEWLGWLLVAVIMGLILWFGLRS